MMSDQLSSSDPEGIVYQDRHITVVKHQDGWVINRTRCSDDTAVPESLGLIEDSWKLMQELSELQRLRDLLWAMPKDSVLEREGWTDSAWNWHCLMTGAESPCFDTPGEALEWVKENVR